MQLGRHETFRGRFHSYNVVGSDENPNDGLINQYTDSLTHRFVDSSIRGLIPSRVPVIPPRHIYIHVHIRASRAEEEREETRCTGDWLVFPVGLFVGRSPVDISVGIYVPRIMGMDPCFCQRP